MKQWCVTAAAQHTLDQLIGSVVAIAATFQEVQNPLTTILMGNVFTKLQADRFPAYLS